MKLYANDARSSSPSTAVVRAIAEIEADCLPEVVNRCAFRVARYCHAGLVEPGYAWTRLFEATDRCLLNILPNRSERHTRIQRAIARGWESARVYPVRRPVLTLVAGGEA